MTNGSNVPRKRLFNEPHRQTEEEVKTHIQTKTKTERKRKRKALPVPSITPSR